MFCISRFSRVRVRKRVLWIRFGIRFCVNSGISRKVIVICIVDRFSSRVVLVGWLI